MTKCWFLVFLWDRVEMERIVFFFPFLLFGSICFQHCWCHIGSEDYAFVLGGRRTSETFLLIYIVMLHYVLFFLLWSPYSVVWPSNKKSQSYHKFNWWPWRISNEKFVRCHSLWLWWLMPQQRSWMILVIISKWCIH